MKNKKVLLTLSVFIFLAAFANAQVYIDGDVYGGGNQASVGSFNGDTDDPDPDASATISVEVNQGIIGSAYGGGKNGSVFGSATVNINGGHIGYEYASDGTTVIPAITKLGVDKTLCGVYGAGLGVGTIVTKGTHVNIGAASSMVEDVHIYGSVYGGGEEGQVGGGYLRITPAVGSTLPANTYKMDDDSTLVSVSGTALANVRYYTYLNPASYGVNYDDVSTVTVKSDNTNSVDITAAVFGGGRGFTTAWNVEGVENGIFNTSPEKGIRGTVYGDAKVEIGTANQDTALIRIGSLDFYTGINTALEYGLVDRGDFSSGAVYWEQNYFVWDVDSSRYVEVTPGKEYNQRRVEGIDGKPMLYNISSLSWDNNVNYYMNTGRISVAGGGEQGPVKGNFNNTFNASGIGGNTEVIVHSGTIGDILYHDQLVDGAVVSVGEVNGCLFGGGFNAEVDGTAKVTFDSPTAWCRGNVFAGGCMAPTHAYKRANEDEEVFATQTFFYEGWGRNVRGGSNLVQHDKGCKTHLVVGREDWANDESKWDNTLVTESCYGGCGFSPSLAASKVEIFSGRIGHVRAGYDLNTTGDAVTQNHYDIDEDGNRVAPYDVAKNTVVVNHQENLLYEGAVYGAGFGPFSHVLNSDITVYGGKIRNGVYGGGEMSGVMDYAYMTNTSEAGAEHLYQYEKRQADGSLKTVKVPYREGISSTNVKIFGGKMSMVCGGGRGYSNFLKVSSNNPGAIFGNTNVYIAGGTIDTVTYYESLDGGSVFGGGLEGEVTGNTNVRIVGGKITGEVYGGGRGYSMALMGEYAVENDNILNRSTNNSGRVMGNTFVHVYDSTDFTPAGAPVIEQGVYGGGSGCNYQITINGKTYYDTVAVVEGNALVDIEAGTIGGGYTFGGISERGSYAGGRIAHIKGYADILVHGNANIASVFGGNDISGYVTGRGRTGEETLVTNGNSSSLYHKLVNTASAPLSRDSTSTYVRIYETPRVGHVFGGGNGKYDYYDNVLLSNLYLTKPTQPSTYVDIDIAKTTLDDNIPVSGYVGQAFGGGNAAEVDTASIHIHGLGLVDTVFGGGNSATVKKVASIYANADILREGSNTDNVSNVNYLFGGNNRATMEILPDIALVSGTFDYVYGGGNAGAMMGTAMREDICGNVVSPISTYVLVNSDQVTVREALFGGCNQAKVATGTFVDVRNTTSTTAGERTEFGIERLFGGNDISDTVSETRIDVNGGFIHNIYGGSNGYYNYTHLDGTFYNVTPFGADYIEENIIAYRTSGRPYVGTTNVNIYGGTVDANIYGGGLAGDCGDTYVVVDDGQGETCGAGHAKISGKIFGGGCGVMDYITDRDDNTPHVGNVKGTAHTDLYRITTMTAGSNAYAGGNAGDVQDAFITVHPAWNQNLEALYGGCYSSDLLGTTHVLMNCNATLTGYNVKYLFGGNDSTGNCRNSIITVNDGRYLSVYGAGNGKGTDAADYPEYEYFTDRPNSENVVLNFYNGTVTNNLYGGGEMGTCYIGDINDISQDISDYAHIVLNVHGGEFLGHIFCGAHGAAEGEQLVYGLKQLNMDNGRVKMSVYGGSENVSDGYPAECLDSVKWVQSTTVAPGQTTARPSTILNIAGGEIGNRVYGGGYLGTIYGSVYLNVGVKAIDSSTVWSNSYAGLDDAYSPFKPSFVSTAQADTGYNLMAHDIYLRNSVYSGSDWGDAKGVYIFNQRGFIGGESRMLIDGHCYNTSISSEGTSLPAMDIVGNLMGSGTSTMGGDVTSHIALRHYGDYVCPTISKELNSIQRADTVFIDSVCLSLSGDQDAYTAYPSPSYSLCRIDTLIFRDANVFRIESPAVYIANITFLDRQNRKAGKTDLPASENTFAISRDVYDYMSNAAIDPYNAYPYPSVENQTVFYDTVNTSSPTYHMGPGQEAIAAADAIEPQLSPEERTLFINHYIDSMQHVVANEVPMCARIDNISPYTKLLITSGVYVDVIPFVDPDNDGVNDATSYGNIEGYAYLVAEDNTEAYVTARFKNYTTHKNELDGGFFSTCDNENTMDLDLPTSPDPIGEMHYTNYGNSYRTWVTGNGELLRSRHIAIVAHANNDYTHSELTNNHKLYRISPTSGIYYNPTTKEFGTAPAEGFVQVDTSGLSDYGLATATLSLPPTASGHYYKIKNVTVDDANGGELKLTSITWDPQENTWLQLNNPTPNDQKNILLDPNFTFGLEMTLGGNFATSADPDYRINEGGCPIAEGDECDLKTVIAGNEYLSQLNGFHSHAVTDAGGGGGENVFPKIDFALTYGTKFSSTILRDVSFVVEEYDEYGHLVAPIDVVVSISTVIKDFSNFEITTLALFNDGITNEYVRKITFPASLSRRDIYLKEASWEPTQVQAKDKTGASYADNFSITQATNTSKIHEGTSFGLTFGLTEDLSSTIAAAPGWYKIYEDARYIDIYDFSDKVEPAYTTVTKNFVNADNEKGKPLGILDGRYAAAIDFTLHFDGNVVYPVSDTIGKIVFTLGYVEGANEGEVNVVVWVKSRQRGDTIYVASADQVSRGGVTVHPYNYDSESGQLIETAVVDNETGKSPNKYVQSFEMALNNKIYQEGDVIAIMDEVKLKTNENLVIRGTDYSIIQVIRYSGSHSEFPGESGAYRGTMVDLSDNARLNFYNMRFDGSGVTNIKATATSDLTKDTLFANAPMFALHDNASLRFSNKITLTNNFNMFDGVTAGGVPGGVVAILGDDTHKPTLELSNNISILNNMVNLDAVETNDARSGAIYVRQGTVALEPSIEGSAIDITKNYYGGTSAASDASTYIVEETNRFVFDTDYFEDNPELRSNVYLTRTPLTEGDELHDAISDYVSYKSEIRPETRIGINKWFPGPDSRDTIQVANVSIANQLYAERAKENGNFVSDSAQYDIFYHPTVSPYRFYLQRCASFKKQFAGDDLFVEGDHRQIPVLKYLMDDDASCPDGGDQMVFSVHGGFYPYTFTWEIIDDPANPDIIRVATSPYSNDVINKDETHEKAIASNSDTSMTQHITLSPGEYNKTFQVRVTAEDLLGCKLQKKISVQVDKRTEDYWYLDGSGDVVYTNDAQEETPTSGALPMSYSVTTSPASGASQAFDLSDTISTHVAKVVRGYKGINVSTQVLAENSWGDVFGLIGSDEVLNATHTHALLCKGDIIDLNAIPALEDGQPKYDFVMWDFDPYDRAQTHYVVPNTDVTIAAYFGPKDYWKDVVNSHPGNGSYTTDYNGNVHIYDEEGLAWLISVVDGFNGQQIRPFFFDSVIVHDQAHGGQDVYDMEAHKWTPVGTMQHKFRGAFCTDENVVIKNVIVNEPQLDHVGFFGTLDSAYISNLHLQRVLAHGQQYVGGIAGYSFASHINNASVTDNNNEADIISIITANYTGGGVLGYSEKDVLDTIVGKAKFMGTSVYSGGIVGYAKDIYLQGSEACTRTRMSANYCGGLVGFATGTVDTTTLEGAKALPAAGSYIANNYVHILSDVPSQRVGGLVGYANNTVLENNYVYGNTDAKSVSGALGATLANNVEVANCYYQSETGNQPFGIATSDVATSNITTFNGSGNQVAMTDRVDGYNNLTLALNDWVRGQNGDFRKWRSDLDGVNHGYPIFGKPDVIRVTDTLDQETCDSYSWFGTEYTASGTYSHSEVDTEWGIDNHSVLRLVLHYSEFENNFDSVAFGIDYAGYGFTFTAAEQQLLRETILTEGSATILLADTLQTVNTCDSVVTLTLTVYGNTQGFDPVNASPLSIKLFPNPTVGQVHVESSANILSVEVYDNLSRRILNNAYNDAQNGTQVIDLSSFASGAYYVRVKTVDGTAIQKIIKR